MPTLNERQTRVMNELRVSYNTEFVPAIVLADGKPVSAEERQAFALEYIAAQLFAIRNSKSK